MLKKKINVVLIAMLFNLCVAKVYAHPHVFVTYKIAFVFDEKNFSGFRINWLFDDITSSMMFEDFDTDKNGKIEGAEVKKIRAEILENMKEYNYFTNIKINGKNFKFIPFQDFKVQVKKNKVIAYDFFVACKIISKKTPQKVDIFLKDSTNFIDFSPSSNPLVFKNSNKIFVNSNDKNFNENSENKELSFTFMDKK